jgi:hypothetical protein
MTGRSVLEQAGRIVAPGSSVLFCGSPTEASPPRAADSGVEVCRPALEPLPFAVRVPPRAVVEVHHPAPAMGTRPRGVERRFGHPAPIGRCLARLLATHGGNAPRCELRERGAVTAEVATVERDGDAQCRIASGVRESNVTLKLPFASREYARSERAHDRSETLLCASTWGANGAALPHCRVSTELPSAFTKPEHVSHSRTDGRLPCSTSTERSGGSLWRRCSWRAQPNGVGAPLTAPRYRSAYKRK